MEIYGPIVIWLYMILYIVLKDDWVYWSAQEFQIKYANLLVYKYHDDIQKNHGFGRSHGK